jgi:AAA15 family ATPase/GTPase
MITSLKFENFKGFRELGFTRLNRLNLFSGANNVGKTSLAS